MLHIVLEHWRQRQRAPSHSLTGGAGRVVANLNVDLRNSGACGAVVVAALDRVGMGSVGTWQGGRLIVEGHDD
jgi:hypothetical protein